MRHAALLLLAAGLPIAAQDPPESTIAAIHDWLAADAQQLELRGKAAAAILADGAPAIRYFGRLLRGGPNEELLPAPMRGRRQALESLLHEVALRWLQRDAERGVIHEGRYAPLEPLLPDIGTVYLRFVLDPPAWFPTDQRARVVPALRDLFREPPPGDALARLAGIAKDVDSEPADLRAALAPALAQWGDRSLVEPRIEELARTIASATGDAKLGATKALAELHYELREHREAAAHGVAWLRAAEAAGARILPVEYYNVACYLSLTGDADRAFAELERAVALHLDEKTDPSWRLARRLFDEDPELRALRRSDRFRALREKAFPAKR
jgi:hypothetical protein